VKLTKQEAKSAFGNPEVYMEKFLENPRHIEIQILCDNFRNCVYLGERDCSMQRRNQKVMEETPAPGIPRRLIDRLGKRCVEACKKIGYRGTGTFEFLYENGQFYFIEMNTRVQVEHTVTEEVTGVDIVAEQIKIAAGERLELKQRDIQINGHAIECRINAEDPYTFVPSPGKVTAWHLPGGPGIRIDTHVFAGYTVPPYYDSLIAKLVAHGHTREQAIARMSIALSEFAVEGIKTNIRLHRDIMEDEKVRQGGVSIHYLEEKLKNRMASQIVTDRNRAAEAESRLRQLIEKQAVRDRHRLELMSSRLDGLSPLKKIGGGYGFLTNDKNRRIESVEQVKKGDLIQMRIRDGRIDAVVSGTAAAELGAR